MDEGSREQERLAALERLDILDTPREQAFDRLTRLACKVFQVPMAAVSLIDAHRQWFKSRQGLPRSETPREHAFCDRTIELGHPLVVPDARADERFASNPYVTGDPHVRFYAGAPLCTRDGHCIGTLCTIDSRPREFGEEQVAILTDLAQMAMDELELRLLADRDALTGAMSRRAFREEAHRAAALAIRHHHPLSLIVFDLDRFKSVNDTHGHTAGDRVLAETVKACQAELRQSDVMGRLGGEEFAALLPETTREGALAAAEKLRRAIGRLEFTFGSASLRPTASLGVATLAGAAGNVDSLLAHADAALYRAKAAGRDRCMAWDEPHEARPRRRVLKGGQILYNGRTALLDCTVRTLSDDGAGLSVCNTRGLPKRFDLVIKADHVDRPCRVVSQTEKHIEVEFC